MGKKFVITVLLLQGSIFAAALDDTCSDGDLLPHPDNCELFYKCMNGELHVISCPDGLHFNEIEGKCDWPDQAECASFEHECADGDVIPHEDNCELFYKCSAGSWHELSCPPGLHFNPTIKQCDWPDAAECEEVEIICSDGDLFPHEEDCELFYQCFANTLVVISCPEGLHFDSTRKACNSPEQAQCAVDREICDDGDVKASSEACDRFFVCNQGQFEEVTCPDGLYFDVSEGVCSFPENVDCELD